MRFRKFLWLLGSLALFSGCATAPPPKLQGSAFETKDLASAVAQRRLTLNGRYQASYNGNKPYTAADFKKDARTDHCARIRDDQMLERSVRSWAPSQVAWRDRESADLQLIVDWDCENLYTDGGGASAAAAVFTLGILPAKNDIKLSLTVSFIDGGKKIFTGKYQQVSSVMINLWADKNGALTQEHYAKLADVLIERFTKDLSRDGALEK